MNTNAEIKLNRIEENLLSHWEYLLEFVGIDDDLTMDDLTDEDRARFRIEMDLFVDSILPTVPTKGWAFWTDCYSIYTTSEALANRLADIIDTFADAHTGYYDPEEDAKSNEIRPDTGYWYVDWD